MRTNTTESRKSVFVVDDKGEGEGEGLGDPKYDDDNEDEDEEDCGEMVRLGPTASKDSERND